MTNSPSKRWYDQDPTVSIAISILRNAPLEHQLLVADLIIKKRDEFDISLSGKLLSKKFRIFSRRWYDIDDKLYTAIEYLRISPIEIQHEISVEIINYLCRLDSVLAQSETS